MVSVAFDNEGAIDYAEGTEGMLLKDGEKIERKLKFRMDESSEDIAKDRRLNEPSRGSAVIGVWWSGMNG